MTLPAELHVVAPRRPADEAPPVTALVAAPVPPVALPAAERLVALERLSDVAVRIATSIELQDTLETIACAVVESLGFDAAVLNIVQGDEVQVAVVKGPREVRDALHGTSQRLGVWEELLTRSDAVGALRFVDGRLDDGDQLEGLLSWVPDIEVTDDEGQWHPMDALFAPLRATTGEMIGVLSVDLPRDGRRPGTTTLELVERFAGMAALAIERARMHKRVADSAELFHRTFEDAPLGMALLTLDGRIEQTNGMYAEMVRRERGELTGLLCWDLVHEQDREAVRTGVLLVAGGTLPVASGDMRDTSGEAWGAATASRIEGPDGPRLLVQMLDVTDQRRATKALRQQAVTDPLTGLRNRAGLAHHLRGLLAGQAEGGTGRVAVLFCDVDRFKLVNDTYGHAVGDELIVHVARALTTELRGTDAAARLGGDEFVVVLGACDGPAGAIAAAERLRSAVCRPVTVGAVTVTPSLSIGIALSEPGSEPDLLLGDADNALYRAKDAGRGRWELFAPQMRDENVARLRLREDLRHAVCGGELRLHYQPLVELGSGRTAGYEALLRWQHPQRGLLSPAAFLDELMQGDLAAAATDWVVEQALADAATWPAGGGVAPYVSINVSPDQLSRPDLPVSILSALQRHGVAPDRLWVEVTEEAVVSDDVQLSALTVLRDAGVHVALDDFGSGYAGLLALRHVPADVVKLDRAFTVNLLEDATTAAIVHAVVRLCETLGRRLVAEGLETAEHVEAVRALGITHGQGWHLGRPQPLATGAAHAEPGRHGADLAGELRRVDAALAAAHDDEEVARVALQAARRIADVDGGLLAVRDGDGQLRTVLTDGYSDDVAATYALIALDDPLPICQAARTGKPVWMSAAQTSAVWQEVVPARLHLDVTLAALPLGTRGAVAVTWSTPPLLDDVLRARLVELAEHVGRRLSAG